ncbi:TraB/GumN family protein [Solitalea lacus]|uniref:TraB/GumN family protein n=1 Tax=Solitalea lacus TaxID=2911172 RepID=UPI001ED9CB29|nr:TraB/GumN family protein [Solitalea lacus]UKJ06561.1 TraB/GumN family protein [Solitalea lacus]
MKPTIVRSFFLGCLFFVCSFVAVARPTADTTVQNTLLWKISGKGLAKPSYLFGTTHLVCKADLGILLPAALKKAILSANEAVFEVYNDDPDKMAKESMQANLMRGHMTLDSLVSPQEMDTINRYFKANPIKGAIYQMLKETKPVLVAGMIGKKRMLCEGEQTSMEEELQYLARLFYKPCSGLSTYTEQMSYLDSVPYRDQAKMLLGVIRKLNNPDINAKQDNYSIQKLYELYKQQKATELFKGINADTKLNDPWVKFVRDDRNLLWVPRIEEKIKQNSAFIAVGFAHLLGDKGLLQLLRNKGYTVEGVVNN